MGSGQYLTAVIDTRAGIARVALRGELDMATVPALEQHLEPFRNDGVSAILLDLRGLTFIDSSGLHALVRASERARTSGHRLILIGTRPSARRLFELTGTEHMLDDQDHIDALKRFAQNGDGRSGGRTAAPEVDDA
jgi:anti-sigma B factor antagonist